MTTHARLPPKGLDMREASRSTPAGEGHGTRAPGRLAYERYRQRVGNALEQTREAWPGLTVYERFEQIVALSLTALIGVVIAAALFHLTIRIVVMLLSGLVDPAEQSVFQGLFGMILTVLIALEFNHSILSVLERKQSIIQVRTVVLIALLALVRKFIILDVSHTEPLTIVGLAAAILALGLVHWLVRDQDRKETPDASRTRSEN
jgi:uncharacterized membrane protein (DUF373 family)